MATAAIAMVGYLILNQAARLPEEKIWLNSASRSVQKIHYEVQIIDNLYITYLPGYEQPWAITGEFGVLYCFIIDLRKSAASAKAC